MISWSINDTHFRRIIFAIEKMISMAILQKKDLPYKSAIDYKQLLVQNILTQKYASTYSPYSPWYAHWKTVTMLSGSHFWRLYGDLLKAITTRQATNGYFSGVPSGVMDSGGKSLFGTRKNPRGKRKPIAMYGRVMEGGLNNHPARPVFGPTRDEYARSGWPVRGRESLKKIGNQWG